MEIVRTHKFDCCIPRCLVSFIYQIATHFQIVLQEERTMTYVDVAQWEMRYFGRKICAKEFRTRNILTDFSRE